MTARLDWQAFVSRFFPGSARHDLRVLKAYEAHINSCSADQYNGKGEADALRVWEEEGGAS